MRSRRVTNDSAHRIAARERARRRASDEKFFAQNKIFGKNMLH
jgi:hypothetical protein